MRKKFTVECEMEERWIDTFLSFLYSMESYGGMGHSGLIGFYADGDGDFKAKFKPDIDYTKLQPFDNYFYTKDYNAEIIFDADYCEDHPEEERSAET